MTNEELQEELQDISHDLEGASGGLQLLIRDLVVAIEDAISELNDIQEAL